MIKEEPYRRHVIHHLHERLAEIHGPNLAAPILISLRAGERWQDLQAHCLNIIDEREAELNQMELRAATIAQIERDLASFRQGIEMMEKDVLTTSHATPNAKIIDTTAKTLGWYRAKHRELTKLLAQYEK